MHRVSTLGVASLSLVLMGCSIHPLPEDVTGVSTYDIVRQIRCETREAARKELVAWLANLGRSHPGQSGIPLARKLAERYEQDPNAISGFRASLFKGREFAQVRNVINIFYRIGIAYNFDLTMTEYNDLSAGSANFQRTFSRSLFKLGIGAGMTRSRSNDRTFTITDTLGNLLTHLNTAKVNGRRYCDGYIVEANYVYPIAGRIGVDKVVHDFLNLALFTGLAGSSAKPGEGGPPTMTDKLSFTTTIDASATPKITFTPTGSAFQLTDATLTGEVKRTDLHKVFVALAVPTNASVYLDSLRSYLFSPARGIATAPSVAGGRRGASSLVVGTQVIGGGTQAEALAVLAIDQLKSRELELVPSP